MTFLLALHLNSAGETDYSSRKGKALGVGHHAERTLSKGVNGSCPQHRVKGPGDRADKAPSASAATLQAKGGWPDFKVLKERNLQPIYPARASFRIEEEMREFLRQAKTRGIRHH